MATHFLPLSTAIPRPAVSSLGMMKGTRPGNARVLFCTGKIGGNWPEIETRLKEAINRLIAGESSVMIEKEINDLLAGKPKACKMVYLNGFKILDLEASSYSYSDLPQFEVEVQEISFSPEVLIAVGVALMLLSGLKFSIVFANVMMLWLSKHIMTERPVMPVS